jgi:hypothetical protein
VRGRVAQALAGALAGQAELSPGLAGELEGALLARLRDRAPAVRAEAARALGVFADPGPVRARRPRAPARTPLRPRGGRRRTASRP